MREPQRTHARRRVHDAWIARSVERAVRLLRDAAFTRTLPDRAMLQKGDHVVCIAPAYQSLHENASCLGCEVTSWDIEADKTGRLRFSVSHSLCNCHKASSVFEYN